jgi:hypothetical protein
LKKPINCIGRDPNWILFSTWKMNRWNPITTSAIRSRSRPTLYLFRIRNKHYKRIRIAGLLGWTDMWYMPQTQVLGSHHYLIWNKKTSTNEVHCILLSGIKHCTV